MEIQEIPSPSDQPSEEQSSKPESELSTASDGVPPSLEDPPATSEVTASVSEAASEPEASTTDPPAPTCDKPASSTQESSSVDKASSEDETQSIAVTASLASMHLNDCPTIIVSKHPESPKEQSATDKAVYLVPPAGVKAGSEVPLAEESEEKEKVEKKEDTEQTETVVPTSAASSSEVSEPAMISPPLVEVQPDASLKITESEHTVETSCGSPSPAMDCTASEALVESEGTEKDTVIEGSTDENAQELSINPGPPVDSPESAPLRSESDVQCSGSPEGDSEGEEPPGSVKAIRDLVMEIIEVEDIVSPCPEAQ